MIKIINLSFLNFFRLVISFSAPLSSVVLMIFGSAFYTTFLSVFLQSEGYSREKIGFIHSSFFLGMFLGAFKMEKLIKKVGHIQALAVFGRRRILLIIVVTALIFSAFIFIYKDATITSLLIFSFFIGGLFFTLYPLSITQVCDHLEHSHITKATALLLIAYGFGSVLGPIISSIIIESFGINAIFLYFIVALGALGLIGIYSTIKRPIVPLEQQTDFQSLPNVTPVAFEMDPRSDVCEEK